MTDFDIPDDEDRLPGTVVFAVASTLVALAIATGMFLAHPLEVRWILSFLSAH